MTRVAIHLCRSCDKADPHMASALRAALDRAGQSATIGTVDCMSGCTRSPTLSVRAPGKTAYLFGEVSRTDIADLLTFLKLYEISATGDLSDARAIGQLRFKAIARIPAGRD